MPGFAFISYSRHDAADYVQRLVEHLAAAGIATWYDRGISVSDQWVQVIQHKIGECGAFIAVMTPAGADSKWISREIREAEDQDRPIFPLLLAGRRYFELANIQYTDVTGGALPPPDFVAGLKAHLPESPPTTAPDAEAVGLQRRHEHALSIGEAGRYGEAARLLSEIVVDRTRVLGAGHPDTLTSRHYSARYQGQTGDRTEAMRLLRDVVADRARILGPDHPDTLASRQSLASFLGDAGDRAEALRLVREVVVDRARILGPDHPDTLRSRHIMASFIAELGERAESIRLLRDVVASFTRLLGHDHRDTLASRHSLAVLIGNAGDRAEAARLLREIVDDYTRTLGPDHPNTRNAKQHAEWFGNGAVPKST